MFHVKHPTSPHHRGRCPGFPTRRGTRSDTGSTFSSITNEASPTTRVSASRSPRASSCSAGHRVESPPGGSLTLSRPPTATSGLPHSAVTAGGPNPRATTSGKDSRSSGSRPAVSARSQIAVTLDSQPSRSTASSIQATDRCRESSRVARAAGHDEREREAGHSTAAAEVQERGRRIAERLRPGVGVVEMGGQRPGPDEADVLRALEQREQPAPLVHPQVRRITT